MFIFRCTFGHTCGCCSSTPHCFQWNAWTCETGGLSHFWAIFFLPLADIFPLPNLFSWGHKQLLKWGMVVHEPQNVLQIHSLFQISTNLHLSEIFLHCSWTLYLFNCMYVQLSFLGRSFLRSGDNEITFFPLGYFRNLVSCYFREHWQLISCFLGEQLCTQCSIH